MTVVNVWVGGALSHKGATPQIPEHLALLVSEGPEDSEMDWFLALMSISFTGFSVIM